MYYGIAGMYVAVLVIVTPGFFQVRFDDGICLSEYYIQGPLGEKLFYANGFVWFFAVYVLPRSSVRLSLWQRGINTVS